MRRAAFFVVLLAVCVQPAAAQHMRSTLPSQLTLPAATAAQSATRSTAAAFGYEALGGMAGSLAGFGLGYAIASDDCETDHPTCLLESAAFTLVISAAAATAGSYIAGRTFDTDPSLLGAAIGSVAGAAAGIGVWHLVTEDLDLVRRGIAPVVIYSMVHGVVTAAGSRIARAIAK